MRNRDKIGADVFATWERFHRRKNVRQKLELLGYMEPIPKSVVNQYGRWRKGADPVPRDKVRIMQDEIIGHIFSERDGEQVKRALFTDIETRRSDYLNEGVDDESEQNDRKGYTAIR